MATGNFYESGDHGLNVISGDHEEAVADVVSNIVFDLKKYSVDSIRINTPRSFDTGMAFAIFNDNSKVVAILEVCNGYYESSNINIYTKENLLNEYDREEVTYNKQDIECVVNAVKRNTTQYKKAYQFSNGETGYVQV